MAALADAEKPWAETFIGVDSVPRPRIFTRSFLAHSPFATNTSNVTSLAPSATRASRFTGVYSTRNGLVKPFSFGMRCSSGSCPPSKPAGIERRAFWPLATAGGLAALAADAAPDDLLSVGRALGRLEIVQLH